MRNDCDFCAELRSMMRDEPHNDGYKKYTVRLIEERIVGRETVGITAAGRYRLRYCPCCGRRIIFNNRE